jgi:hypothetical protein
MAYQNEVKAREEELRDVGVKDLFNARSSSSLRRRLQDPAAA